MTIPRLMIVEDDVEMQQVMGDFLRRNGFMVLIATNEQDIRSHLEQDRIDLILLDVMLGDEDGVEICRRLRQDHDVPVIFVSTLSADHQRMMGYEVGADDYIAKPFNPELLLARVHAVLRRAQRSPSLVYRRATAIYEFAGWVYDGKRNEVQAPGGYQVTLSRRETQLLKVLLANPHVPLTRDEIAAALDLDDPDPAESSGRAIDVLVGRLRTKIEEDPKDPQLLRTEYGVGYVFAVDVSVRDA